MRARYHFMDRLRATMMLLGIVLHTALSYTDLPMEFWPYKDGRSSLLLDLLSILIHSFRMPVFLIVAGFFANHLYRQHGETTFLHNRLQRIAIPLLSGWLLLYPLVAAVRQGAAPITETLRSGALWQHPTLIHLWFLYYLLLLYAGTLIALRLARLPLVARCWRAPQALLLRAVATPRLGLPLFIMLSVLAALPMRNGGLDPPGGLLPEGRIVAACAVYFAFGWLLYVQRDALPVYAQAAGWRMVGGLILLVAFLAFRRRFPQSGPAVGVPLHLLSVAAWTACTWLMAFGLLGWFQRRYDRPSELWRYLSDASYWMYLLHLPLVLWLSVALHGYALPALLKAGLVVAIATSLLVLSYHWLVRGTWLGAFLNGRNRSPAPATVSRQAPAG